MTEINTGLSNAIIKSMAKWNRKPADTYPTPVDCTYSLLPHIAPLLSPNARVLEPACANGQMVDPLREFGYQVDGFDLRPDVTGGMGGVDFLDPENFKGAQYDAVITNPPFSAAQEFLRRSLEVAPVVAMLLKQNYWSAKKRKELFRELTPYLALSITWRVAFLPERGDSPLMDCAWFVWLRGHSGHCKMDVLDRLTICPVNLDMGGL